MYNTNTYLMDQIHMIENKILEITKTTPLDPLNSWGSSLRWSPHSFVRATWWRTHLNSMLSEAASASATSTWYCSPLMFALLLKSAPCPNSATRKPWVDPASSRSACNALYPVRFLQRTRHFSEALAHSTTYSTRDLQRGGLGKEGIWFGGLKNCKI